MQHITPISIAAVALFATMSYIPAAVAEGEDLPDLAITYVKDRLGGLVLEENMLRERHFTTVTVQNLGTAPAGLLYFVVDVDPVDEGLPDTIPEALGGGGGDVLGGLPAGASTNVTIEWSILPAAYALEVRPSAHLFRGNESSYSNNVGSAPAESSMPATLPVLVGPLEAMASGNAVRNALDAVYARPTFCGSTPHNTQCDQLSGEYGDGQIRACTEHRPDHVIGGNLHDTVETTALVVDALVQWSSLPAPLDAGGVCTGAWTYAYAAADAYGRGL